MPRSVAITEMIIASHQHEPADLRPLAPTARMKRQFAEALADRDVVDVVDHERRDERGDEGEDQQAGAEDRHDLTDLVLGLVGDLLAGDDLGARGEDLRDRGFDRRRCRRPSAILMSMVSTSVLVSSQLAGRVGSQTTVVAPTKPSELPSPTSRRS